MFRSDLCSSSLDHGPRRRLTRGCQECVPLHCRQHCKLSCRRCLFGWLHLEGDFTNDYVHQCFRVTTAVIENETLCGLPRLAGQMSLCRHTSSACLGFRKQNDWKHCAFVIMCPMSFTTAGITFSSFFQFPQIADEDRSNGKHDEPTGNLPLPLLLPFSFHQRNESSYICFHQLPANFWVKISVPCVSETSNCTEFSCLAYRPRSPGLLRWPRFQG